MKNILIILALTLSFSVSAQDLGHMESHGNPEDEERCSKEIRALGCGNPDQQEAFISCVNTKISQLSKSCQTFHKDELERMKGH